MSQIISNLTMMNTTSPTFYYYAGQAVYSPQQVIKDFCTQVDTLVIYAAFYMSIYIILKFYIIPYGILGWKGFIDEDLLIRIKNFFMSLSETFFLGSVFFVLSIAMIQEFKKIYLAFIIPIGIVILCGVILSCLKERNEIKDIGLKQYLKNLFSTKGTILEERLKK